MVDGWGWAGLGAVKPAYFPYPRPLGKQSVSAQDFNTCYTRFPDPASKQPNCPVTSASNGAKRVGKGPNVILGVGSQLPLLLFSVIQHRLENTITWAWLVLTVCCTYGSDGRGLGQPW